MSTILAGLVIFHLSSGKFRCNLFLSKVMSTYGAADITWQVLQHICSSRQNCVLIADGELAVSSLLGVVTPRDAMRAFAEHVPVSVQVGPWLRALRSDWAPRAVDADEALQDCARRMVEHSVHHLVVTSSSGVAGVVSSTDLAHAIGSAERVVEVCSGCVWGAALCRIASPKTSSNPDLLVWL